MRVRVFDIAQTCLNRWRRHRVPFGVGALTATSLLFLSVSGAAGQDIVLRASDVSTISGNWARLDSSSGAGNQKMTSADYGWSSSDGAQANPNDYFDATFTAQPWVQYRVWLRARATGDSKWNDSVWVQFSDALDAGGNAVYGIGTGSALLVNLEACYDCGVSSWGWTGGAWWLSQSVTVQFPSAGTKTIRVQTREDGIDIDQIVLSPSNYLGSAPGSSSNDGTILTSSGGIGGGTPTSSPSLDPPPSTSSESASSAPFGGTAWAVPGTIQCEDFDSGGEGVGYHDHSAGNNGGAYRATDVDIAGTSTGGNTVGWAGAGEWLRYTVNVSTSGQYALTARIASAGDGGSFHIEFNGQDKTGSMWVPNTGGWDAYQDVNASVWLEAGVQTMRLVLDSNGSTGAVGNFSSVRLEAGAPPAVAVPAPLPAPEPPPPTVESPTPPPPPPSSGGGGTIRVMTWNIQFGMAPPWNWDPWGQAHVIANSGADVVLLQEVQLWDEHMPTTYAQRLQQLTGQNWASVWAPHGGRYTDNEGTLILTRLPLVRQSSLQAYERGFAYAGVDVGGVLVNLFSIHLDGWDSGRRTAQLLEFMNWARQIGGPKIAGGDFNAWWDEWWIHQMETEFSDTWRDVTGGIEGGYTLNNAIRFDYLFRAFDQNWRITPTATWVTWTDRSDHLPVIADYVVR